MADSKSEAHGLRPNRACIAPSRRPSPGVEKLSGPLIGMPFAYCSTVAAFGQGRSR